MLLTQNTNLLDVQSGIILHGVNAQGKMGLGLAWKVREKYPQVYEDYIYRGQTRGFPLGSIIITDIIPELCIISGVTQQFYGRQPGEVYSSVPAILKVFRLVANYAVKYKDITTQIHYPKIGCGLGGMDWQELHPKIIAQQDDRLTYILHDFQG
jgi:O-acetyl-ADP-ribose deacetylase (regulator of RNase III)